jgi:hypothetical protein
MWIRAALLLLALSAPVAAAEIDAPGAKLRLLDRLSEKLVDLSLAIGGSSIVGRISVTVDACRYPAGEPNGSIAHLTIKEEGKTVFDGWMSAESPALNALDHPRYDVWLLACATGG